MKECLNCKKEYQERRISSRFCSNKCRAAFHRGSSKNKLIEREDKLAEMFNAILGAVNSINARNGQPETFAAVIVPKASNDPKIKLRRPFLTLQALIAECESMDEYEPLRKEVEEADHLTSQQKAILLRKR